MTGSGRLAWKSWFWPLGARQLFMVGVLVSLVLYAAGSLLSGGVPGGRWQIGFGIAATAFLVAASLYGVRRRSMRFGPARANTWLKLHLYGGGLFFLLVLLHTGFQVPAGVLTLWIWIFSLWITLSGLGGRLIQRWIPRLITGGLSTEAHYHRIPDLIGEIRKRAESVLPSCSDAVRDFYTTSLAPALAGPQPRLVYYMDVTGGIHSRTEGFAYLSRILPAGEREKLNELEGLFRTKLELDAQYTLQRALRWWIYTHVPVSLVLLVLVAVHVYTVLRY